MNISSNILQQAIEFAVEKHKGVTRKGNGRPYILHPMSVLLTLLEIKSKTKNGNLLATVCILHDVVEDCDVTLKEISERFGYQVAALVEELTSDPDKIKELGKTAYLIMKMLNMSSYALCIKLVDRLDNIKDMKEMDIEFVKKTITSTNQILYALESGRKLTGTHRLIIDNIKFEINKYEI